MTLAEELMGKRPEIQLSPGRAICRLDPIYVRNSTPFTQMTDDWLAKQTTFTAYDVCTGLDLDAKKASAQIRRWKKHRLIECVGEMKTHGNKLKVWAAVSQ